MYISNSINDVRHTKSTIGNLFTYLADETFNRKAKRKFIENHLPSHRDIIPKTSLFGVIRIVISHNIISWLNLSQCRRILLKQSQLYSILMATAYNNCENSPDIFAAFNQGSHCIELET